MNDLTIIGAEEWCKFPTLGIPAIKARVDSGAKTSSLHAFNIERFENNSNTWVRFEIHPLQKDKNITVKCEAQIIDKRKVKSTSGISEKRFVIQVPLSIGNDTWDVEVTLTNRDSMGYRMLLGREAMLNRYLINPSASFLQGNKDKVQLANLYK